ncbi:MAG: FG-GAP-like repeat-containing protein [Cyclobacteriaceae bacterium]|nr:FG-GAP-like repeat-containing protein [Cyclobacteriaceae bacterium]
MTNFRRLFFLFGVLISQALGVYAQAPTITSIDYRFNYPKEVMVITGINYGTAAEMVVLFGGVEGNVLSSNGTQLEVEIPGNASAANIDVINTTTELSVSSPDKFFTTFHGTTPFSIGDLQNPIQFGSAAIQQFDVCSCDFDGDGRRDMVTTNSGGVSLQYYRNTTTDPTNIQFFESSQNIVITSRNITCSDLNGDGLPELIFGRNDVGNKNFIYVLENNSTVGNIAFGTSKQFQLDVGYEIVSMLTNDLDYDGKPEIIATSAHQTENNIFILKNQSSGGVIDFSNTPVKIDMLEAGVNGGLEIEDMDGDRKPEIIVAQLGAVSGVANIYILKNNSGVNNISFDAPVAFDVGKSIQNMKVGDLNSDGKADIAVTNLNESKLSVVVNNTTPSSGLDFSLVNVNLPTDQPWGIDLGDLDGDGDLDIVTCSNNSATLDVFINNTLEGATSIDLAAPITKTLPTRTRNIQITDINNDAKPDILYTGAKFGAYHLGVIRNTNCFVPEIEGDATRFICDQPIQLNSIYNPAAVFNWYKDGVLVQGPAHGTNTVNESEFIVALGEVGDYKIIIETPEGGACDLESNLITVDPAAGTVPGSPTVVNDGPGCEGTDVVLTVNFAAPPPVGITYEWVGPNNFSATLTDNPSVTISNVMPENIGKYTVVVAAGPCETNEISTNVEVISLPEFSVTATGDIAFCTGGSTPLKVNTLGGYTYQWLKDGLPIGGETSANYTATEVGLYSVEVTEVATTCVAITNEVEISIFTSPVADFNFPSSICLDESISFSDISSTDPSANVNYLWSFGNGNTSTEQNPFNSFNLTGSYTVTLIINYVEANCSSSNSYVINVVAPEVLNIEASSDGICEDEDVILSTNIVVTNPIWNTLESTPSITVNASGVYNVSGNDANGCVVTAPDFELLQKTVPNITIIASSLSIFSGDIVNLEAQGADTYLWSPSETLTDTTSAVTEGTPEETITYFVEGSLVNGCSAVDSITIEVEPTINTAYKVLNVNGINPILTIENKEVTAICVLTIFDRNGSKVFEMEGGNTLDWDGSGNGGKLPQGTYFYVFNCGEAEPTTGSILLIRS